MGKSFYALSCAAWLACNAAIAASGPSASVISGKRGPDAVLPLDAKVEGLGYPELTARWWQWAEAAPIEPFLDPDGRLCDMDQDGPVWFLAGTSGNGTVRRECVVPANKHLLLPIINMVYWQPDPQYTGGKRLPCKDLQASAAVNNDKLVSAVVLLDGVPVPDIAHYRVRSAGCFPIVVDADGKAVPDTPKAAADGYWLLLAPLSPGRHTIVVGANYGTGKGYGSMVQSFEYALHVGGQANVAALRDSKRGHYAVAIDLSYEAENQEGSRSKRHKREIDFSAFAFQSLIPMVRLNHLGA